MFAEIARCPKMNIAISVMLEREGIQDFELVSSRGNRLGPSQTKVIPTAKGICFGRGGDEK